MRFPARDIIFARPLPLPPSLFSSLSSNRQILAPASHSVFFSRIRVLIYVYKNCRAGACLLEEIAVILCVLGAVDQVCAAQTFLDAHSS